MWLFTGLGVLQLLFLVLKITKAIAWSWWFIWIPAYILIIILVCFALWFRVI